MIIDRKEIGKLTVAPEQAVRDAVEVIDSGGAQIAFVVEEDLRLIGTVTDGDVRRALLRGASIHDAIKTIMNPEFRSVHKSETLENGYTFMNRLGLRQLPIIDDQGLIASVIMRDTGAVENTINNTVVIMAGGRGTRLGGLTQNQPKPMLQIGD